MMRFDHDYSTEYVWQMAFSKEGGVIEAHFREIKLPRPMRVTYPRDVSQLADDWTHASLLIGAFPEDVCVGYLSLTNSPVPDTGWVTDLVVDSPFRRQGIATQLLGAAKNWCEQNDLNRITVEMQSKNYPMIALAKKLGFRYSGYSDSFYPDQEIALFFSFEI
jgi:GNAT superfamily N-acetyltransferase